MALNLELSADSDTNTFPIGQGGGDSGNNGTVDLLAMETVGPGDPVEDVGQEVGVDTSADLPAADPLPATESGSEDNGDSVENSDDSTDTPTLDDSTPAVDPETSADPSTDPSTPSGASHILDDIHYLEEVCRQKESIVNNLKEELKGAKDELDAAILNLRNRAWNSKDGRRTPRPAASDSSASVGASGSETFANDQSAGTPLPNPDWQSSDILSLVNYDLSPNIAQFLKGKTLLSTVGELVDFCEAARADASRWPKGIGKGKVELITDALNKFLAENRDGIVPTEEVPVSPPNLEAEKEGEREAEVGQRVDIASESPGESLTLDDSAAKPISAIDPDKFWKNWRNWSEEVHSTKILAWAEHLKAANLPSPLACQNPDYTDCWKEGFDCRESGIEIVDCQISPNTQDFDEWMRGWLSADKGVELNTPTLDDDSAGQSVAEQSDSADSPDPDPNADDWDL